MVQFQKWRAETYVKACQQLLFHAVIDSVCKSEAHRYECLAHSTKMYLPAWDTNPCACRLWFITTNIFSCGRFGACAAAPARLSACTAAGTQRCLQRRVPSAGWEPLPLRQAPASGGTCCFPSTRTQQLPAGASPAPRALLQAHRLEIWLPSGFFCSSSKCFGSLETM